MKEDILAIKSKSFAIKIVNLYKKLSNENKEYVLSKQLLRSGTSIGANIREAGFAQSQGDFISKLSIALKETNESLYWIEILHDTEFIDGLTSTLLTLKLWIKPLKLNPSIRSCKLPIYTLLNTVSCNLPLRKFSF